MIQILLLLSMQEDCGQDHGERERAEHAGIAERGRSDVMLSHKKVLAPIASTMRLNVLYHYQGGEREGNEQLPLFCANLF